VALSKTVFINRTDRASAIHAFDAAVETMHRERQSVYIFPEGTRSYASEPMLLPFKKGAFHLAIQAQVPLVPVVVANYSHVLNVKKRIFRSGSVPVKVLPPIETKGMKPTDVEELTKRVRELMLKEIGPLTFMARANGGAEPMKFPAEVESKKTS
jgi:lysophosphatidate acyltransferase